jgi:hypothetical protein
VAPVIHRRQLGYALRVGTRKHLGRQTAWRVAARDGAARSPIDVADQRGHGRPRADPLGHQNQPGGPSLGDRVNRIKSGIAVYAPIEHADIPQPVGSVVLFHLLYRGRPRRVVIDTDDRLIL